MAYTVHRTTLCYDHGRLLEAEDEVKAVIEQSPGTYNWRGFLAELHATLGDDRVVAARQEFHRLAARDFAEIPRDVLWFASITKCAMACTSLGDAPRAATLYDLLHPYVMCHVFMQGLVVAPAYWGCVSYYLGLLATALTRWDEAAGHFTLALELHERMGARPWLARTQRHYAALLLARDRVGDLEVARGLLEQAHDTSVALGMAALREDVERLQQEGVRPPLQDSGELTEREVEVLRLIAAGKSNREIGGILVISANTVAHHVGSILTKTGSANRAEAASYAARHGLVW